MKSVFPRPYCTNKPKHRHVFGLKFVLQIAIVVGLATRD